MQMFQSEPLWAQLVILVFIYYRPNLYTAVCYHIQPHKAKFSWSPLKRQNG